MVFADIMYPDGRYTIDLHAEDWTRVELTAAEIFEGDPVLRKGHWLPCKGRAGRRYGPVRLALVRWV